MTDKSIFASTRFNWPYEICPDETDGCEPFIYFDTINGSDLVWQYYDRYSEMEIEYRPATQEEKILIFENKVKELLIEAKKERYLYRIR